MKFIVCAGIVIGAPFAASFAVDSLTVKVNNWLDVTGCERIAKLEKITMKCK